jgi:hypothetical protein
MSNPYTIQALIRRKKIDQSSIDDSKLARVLSTFDLTCLGMKFVLLKSFQSLNPLFKFKLFSLKKV